MANDGAETAWERGAGLRDEGKVNRQDNGGGGWLCVEEGRRDVEVNSFGKRERIVGEEDWEGKSGKTGIGRDARRNFRGMWEKEDRQR